MKKVDVYTTITYRGSERNPMTFRVPDPPHNQSEKGFGYLNAGDSFSMKVRPEWIIELAKVLESEPT